MNEPFIAVFTEENRDALIEQGFNLLYGDTNYYLFENDVLRDIDLPSDQYVLTSVMSFVGLNG